MSRRTHIPIPDIEHWTIEQVLAVYDVCQMISATLIARYEDQLVEKMIKLHQQDSQRNPRVPNEIDDNLQLPFDELP